MNFQFSAMASKAGPAVFSLMAFLFFSHLATAQSKAIDVDSFDKVIVSPHIEVIFKAGEEESVSIESINVPMEKLNVEVKNNTLHLYLDDAKITAKKVKEYINGNKRKTPIYKGTVVRAVITYRDLNSLDLRGEQKFVFEDNLKARKLVMKVYGEPQIYIKSVDIQDLSVTMYGECYLEIEEGRIENQTFTAYGESQVEASEIYNESTKLTAYGDAEFELNVSGKLKVTSYGEAIISYKGNPNVQRGIIIGETQITSSN